MNNKVYLWHPKCNDFWIVSGVENHWLLGICYVISDRSYKKKEFFEVDRNPLLVKEDAIARFDAKKLRKRLAECFRGCTLMTCDQPSLLIED